MSVLVKICGINSVDAADAACAAGADFAGLVFHTKSPRNLALDEARALANRMRGRLKLVALFADAREGEIREAVAAVGPDFIQFHGSESPQLIADARLRLGIPVIKALPIADISDFADAARFDAAADMLLFDAKPPRGASRPGGHGASFDWQLLRGRSFAKPWLLSGGLTAENAPRAIRACDAPGVDVSSGVESAPGVKSAQMIREFVAAARAARYSESPA